MRFEHAAAQFGLGYARPASMPDFEAAYRTALAAGTPVLIEIVTNRAENIALHRQVQGRVAAVVEEALGA